MRAPEKTIEAATCMFGPHEDVARLAAVEALDAAMASDLGPDRLVVAGPHEQHVIHQIVAWLDNEAERAFVQDRTDSGLVLRNVAEKIALEFEMDPAIGNGIEDDYR